MRRMLLFVIMLIAVVCWLRRHHGETVLAQTVLARTEKDNGERYTAEDIEKGVFDEG